MRSIFLLLISLCFAPQLLAEEFNFLCDATIATEKGKDVIKIELKAHVPFDPSLKETYIEDFEVYVFDFSEVEPAVVYPDIEYSSSMRIWRREFENNVFTLYQHYRTSTGLGIKELQINTQTKQGTLFIPSDGLTTKDRLFEVSCQ